MCQKIAVFSQFSELNWFLHMNIITRTDDGGGDVIENRKRDVGTTVLAGLQIGSTIFCDCLVHNHTSLQCEESGRTGETSRDKEPAIRTLDQFAASSMSPVYSMISWLTLC